MWAHKIKICMGNKINMISLLSEYSIHVCVKHILTYFDNQSWS